VAYLLLRLLVNALAIAIIARVLPGITVVNNELSTFVFIGLVFGVINAVVKPLLTLLTCSLVILTFGLFILVINGLVLLLTSSLLGDIFVVDGLGPAILGGIIISIINMILESALGDREKGSKVEVRIND
jgi:putative membrane protein